MEYKYTPIPKLMSIDQKMKDLEANFCREQSEWPYFKDDSISYPKGLIRFSNFPRKMRGVGESLGAVTRSSSLGAALCLSLIFLIF